MTTKKGVLRHLHEQGIPCVLIGGMALRLYDSPRITHDMDLAVRGTDQDEVVEAMYAVDFVLVTAVDPWGAAIRPAPREALLWIEENRPSSLSFLARPASRDGTPAPPGKRVPLNQLDITSQVDFLFDLCIPFPRLRQHARHVSMDDFEILLASPEDLLTLKENRGDKDAADRADIGFLQALLEGESGNGSRA